MTLPNLLPNATGRSAASGDPPGSELWPRDSGDALIPTAA